MTDTEIDPAWTIHAGENSYVSLADADAIASTRLFASAWTGATGRTQAQALMTATALLERMR